MRSWQHFWSEFPATVGGTEFLRQVGHTLAGEPYTPEQFAAMIASIRSALHLTGKHRLLDLCCGNGVITRELSPFCDLAVGVDFSAPLIGIAKLHNEAGNIRYVLGDALNIGQTAFEGGGHFDRILLYAALQHFETGDLPRLLSGLSTHAEDGAVILIGGILDASRKHLYLDTPEKILRYESYGNEGRDRLGTWWEPALLRDTCKAFGFGCDIDQLSPARPGAQFRFDARITA